VSARRSSSSASTKRGALGAEELVLFDPDPKRVDIMVGLGQAIVAREGGSLRVRRASSIEDAIEGSSFVLNSIRVGRIQARMHDERTSIEHGYPASEHGYPARRLLVRVASPWRCVPWRSRWSRHSWSSGAAHRRGSSTLPIRLDSSRRLSSTTSRKRCRHLPYADRDAAPHQHGTGARPDEVRCEYLGLNHLGWVRRIHLRGEDVTGCLLGDDAFLGSSTLCRSSSMASSGR
jgi:6-phospho-beta-glucosidase